MINLEFNEWEFIYNNILKDFGFNKKDDEKSAFILSELVKNKSNIIETIGIQKLIKNKEVYIFGGAVSSKILNDFNGILISADGATTALLKNKIIPEIIVTDLDGIIKDILYANEKKSIAIIHAHGDNIDKVKKYLPKFKGKILCTTQSRPIENVYNFGGFTDGDRAVYLADFFHAKKINLIGFDYNKIGKFSFSENRELKLKKLKWAEKLIERIDKNKIMYL